MDALPALIVFCEWLKISNANTVFKFKSDSVSMPSIIVAYDGKHYKPSLLFRLEVGYERRRVLITTH